MCSDLDKNGNCTVFSFFLNKVLGFLNFLTSLVLVSYKKVSYKNITILQNQNSK